MHNLLTFPHSAEQDRRIIRIKAQILGTLRASELPGCYLRKPVSLLDIRQYCEALNEPEEPWVCGTGELLADGLITTRSRNGHLFLTLRSAPLPPDYEGDQGDETEPISKVSCGGTCAGRYGIGEHSVSELPTAHTGEETQASQSAGIVSPLWKKAAVSASKQMDELAEQNRRNYLREIEIAEHARNMPGDQE